MILVSLTVYKGLCLTSVTINEIYSDIIPNSVAITPTAKPEGINEVKYAATPFDRYDFVINEMINNIKNKINVITPKNNINVNGNDE